MPYTLRKCKLCRYITVMNKILPRYVRTHEWPYWFILLQHPASKVTVCGCPGESRNRTNIPNNSPKHSPRFSLFSAEEISQAVCVYSKTPSGLSIRYVSTWIHVHFLHPWHPLAEFHRLTICVQMWCQMFLSVTCLVCWWKEGMIFVAYDSPVSLLWSRNGGFSCSVNNPSPWES